MIKFESYESSTECYKQKMGKSVYNQNNYKIKGTITLLKKKDEKAIK